MNHLRFANSMITAQSVAKILSSDNKHFSPRPWNRFEPNSEDSLWWVVPDTNWPAYKYGKYVFQNVEGTIQCGLHIEKGFGTSARLAYPALKKKGLVTEKDWMWNKFVADLESGKVSEALSRVEELSGEKIIFTVSSGLAGDPTDYDPYAPKTDNIEFIIKDGILSLSQSELVNGTLKPLLKAAELSQIATILPVIDVLDWVWLDIFITVAFRKAAANMDEDIMIIDGYQLCNILHPLERWVGFTA